MTDVTTDAEPATVIPGQEDLIPMTKKEKDAAAAAAKATAAAGTREYVCLERVDLRAIVLDNLGGDSAATDALAFAIPTSPAYVEVARGHARNADAALKDVAKKLGRPATVVCTPASQFAEKFVRYKQVIEVSDSPDDDE